VAKVTASASPRCGYQSWGVSLSLKLVVVRTTSWREGVLLGRPRVLPDRNRVYGFTPVSTLYLDKIFQISTPHHTSILKYPMREDIIQRESKFLLLW
jgi:hypothetical protein